MSDARTDPLSLALSCVRRLSDEGLDELSDALGRETKARDKERVARARWHTFYKGSRGRSQHVLADADSDLVRAMARGEGDAGRVRSVCGRAGTFTGRVIPEGEPECAECLRRWKRPA